MLSRLPARRHPGRILDAIPDIISPELAPILNQLATILQQQ